MSPSFSRSDALIMVMETSNFGDDSHWTTFRRFDRAGHWTIHGEGKMGPKSVVIAEVSRQETHQVSSCSTTTWSSTSRRILPMTLSQ